MTVRRDGIDLSHYQGGDLDFHAARRAGVLFVSHKTTEALDPKYVDAFYTRRRREVADAGMLFGGYHFARPGQSGGAAQAQWFLRHATPGDGDLWPMLDLEDDDGLNTAQLTAWVDDWVTVMRREVGCVGFIYTQYDLDDDFAAPLWRARYSDAMSLPTVPKPWRHWTVWQWSNGEYPHTPLNLTPGIGHVDANMMHTTMPAKLLERFTLGGPKPKPKPEPNVPNAYDRISSRGVTLNRRTDAMLTEMERRLGYPLSVTQGSYHAGFNPSGGTHDGGGAVDLANYDWENKVRVGRDVGFAIWHRTADQGDWNDHLHGIAIGDKELSSAAADQVDDYYAHKDGLYYHRPDNTPHPDPIPVFDYAAWMKEDDMQDADFEKIAAIVADKLAPLEKAVATFRANEMKRDTAEAERDSGRDAILDTIMAALAEPTTAEKLERARAQLKRLRDAAA